jgi:polyisoprenoid-binding protein YceI
MKVSSTFLAILTAAVAAVPAGATAAPRIFGVVAPAASRTGIEFDIGYTGGTHLGRAEAVSGQATLDIDNLAGSTALFSVPLTSLNTDNTKRDCHMREALGINYSVSIFPEGGHVCPSTNVLSSTGPDKLAFDKITFLLKGLMRPDGSRLDTLTPGIETPVLAQADWNIHGVTHSQVDNLTLTLENNDRVRVRGTSKLVLKDFGIEVLPFLIITVSDFATARYDVVLQAR